MLRTNAACRDFRVTFSLYVLFLVSHLVPKLANSYENAVRLSDTSRSFVLKRKRKEKKETTGLCQSLSHFFFFFGRRQFPAQIALVYYQCAPLV